MSNITQRAHGHNRTAAARSRPGATVARLALAVILIGAAGAAAAPCPLEIDLTTVESFMEVSGRLTRGEEVSSADCAALFARDDYRLLVESSGDQTLNAQVLENVLRHVFRDTTRAEEADGGAQHVRLPKRRDLVTSFTYLKEHREELQRFLKQFRGSRAGCRIFERLEGFVPADRLTADLTLSFVPMKPEVRLHEGRMLVDAGLALAAGPDQLANILASLIFRDLQAPGVEPAKELSGLAALRATFIHLGFQGVACYLESYGDLAFDEDHPMLAQPPALRAKAIEDFPRVQISTEKYLKILLDNEQQLRDQGGLIDDLLRGGSSYEATGYAMALLIVARFGEERLQRTIGDARAFLEAYQEAALLKRVVSESAIPEGYPAELVSMDAFDEELFPRLLAVLPAAR